MKTSLGQYGIRMLAVALPLLLVACATDVRMPPKNLISFGDSLSDLGSYSPRNAAVGGGKFTVNPGPIWVETVARHYDLKIGPNRTGGWGFPISEMGGTAYGEGGSRVSQQPGSNNTDASKGAGSGQTTRPVREQISTHLAAHGGKFQPEDLVLVWAGANDVFRHVLFAPAPSQEVAEARIREAADELVADVRRMAAAGARRMVVLNLEDYGTTPSSRSAGAEKAALLTAVGRAFNVQLAKGLTGTGALLVDVERLYSRIKDEPAKFGLTNVRDQACRLADLPMRSVTYCTRDTLTSPEAAATYLYADGVHPSPAGHRIIAEQVLSALDGRGKD
jgi:phospholipase/lecithinase/hemolysin